MRILAIILCVLYSISTNAQDFFGGRDYAVEVSGLQKEKAYSKAVSLSKKALKIVKAQGSNQDSLLLFWNKKIGYLYYAQRKLPNALYYYNQVANLEKKDIKQNGRKYASTLHNMATINTAMRRYRKAESQYLKSIKVKEAVLGKKHEEYLYAKLALSHLYVITGKYAKAELLLKEAMLLSDSLKSGSAETRILVPLGKLYIAQGESNAAEPLFIKALALYRSQNPQNTKAIISLELKLADLYASLSEYEKAHDILINLANDDKIKNGPLNYFYPSVLQSLGFLYNEQAKYKLAIKCKKEAISHLKKKKGERDISLFRYRLNLIDLYIKTDELALASKLLLETYDKVKGMATYREYFAFNVLRKKGVIELGKENYTAALVFYKEALAIVSYTLEPDFTDYTQLGEYGIYRDKKKAIVVLEDIGRCLKQMYLKDKSAGYDKDLIQLAGAGIHIIQEWKDNVYTEKDKLRILAISNNFTALFLSIAADIKSEALLNQAFLCLEQNKAVLLASDLSAKAYEQETGIPKEIIRKKESLEALRDSLHQSMYNTSSDTLRNQLNLRMVGVQEAYKQHIKFINKEFPNYLSSENRLGVSVEELQQRLKANGADELFLEYFVSPKTTYVFVIQENTFELVRLNIRKKDLANQVKELNKSLSNYSFLNSNKERAYNHFTQNARKLYTMVLEKALANRSFSTLKIVTDFSLGKIPFEVLLTEVPSQKVVPYNSLPYLLKRCPVSYSNSAEQWMHSLAARKNVIKNNNKVLMLAGDYMKSTNIDQLLKLRGDALTATREELNEIPGAKVEADLISKIFEGLVLSGSNASEKKFKEQASKYSVLHFATHGVVNPQEPKLSALVLSETLDTLEDNFLEAHEIEKLKLNAELVVLSACESGLGKYAEGEGMLSVAYSFMRAGTPSVVMSLWRINDYSTSVVMELFYKHLSKGKSKSKALRQAKLDYLLKAKGNTTHPAYWAAFVQMGDTAPIGIQKKLGMHYFWLLGGAFLVLGLFWWLRLKK